jgi:transposase
MRCAVGIELSERERSVLETTACSRRAEVCNCLRARIVLLAADGESNREIAKKLSIKEHTVATWRRRFSEQRLAGLHERAGRGRRKLYGAQRVEQLIEATLHSKPKAQTHWSTRTMAKASGISHATVSRIWRSHEIKPHLVRTFKLSDDKHFTEKLRDVVGLYLDPPEHAWVLCIDEKSQIQALDRTQPGLPLKKGRCGTLTHDYKRHGTTTLFAALNVLDGKVIGTCMKRHRHEEYLKFLRQIDRETPKHLALHLIADNYATHKHEKVKQWLAKRPRFHMHFIPTSSSWLNLVERFFRELTDKRIRRGVFRSVSELTEAIYEYLQANNNEPKPFVWTKQADEILNKLAPLYSGRNTAA